MPEGRHCNVVLVNVIDIWLPGSIRRWAFGAFAKERHTVTYVSVCQQESYFLMPVSAAFRNDVTLLYKTVRW